MTYSIHHAELNELSANIIRTIDTMFLPHNATIIYDIDDTLINTRGYLLQPIVDTYHYAKSKGIQTVIVTNRPGSQEGITYTQEQLKYHGLHNNSALYMRPPTKNDPWKFKYAARKNVHERGMTVIMSVGDQPWDIGEYGGVGITVPIADPNLIHQYF